MALATSVSCTQLVVESPSVVKGTTFEVGVNCKVGLSTKTSIDGNVETWNAGDRLGVFAEGIQQNRAFGNIAGSSAFSGSFERMERKEDAVNYYAYYPYTDNADGHTIKSTLSSRQTAPFDPSQDFMVSEVINAPYDESAMPGLEFRFANHLFGIVRIVLTNTKEELKDERLSAVTLYSPGACLGGDFIVDVSKGSQARPLFTGNIHDYVTLSYAKDQGPKLGLGEKHELYAVVMASTVRNIKVIINTQNYKGSVESSFVLSFMDGYVTSLPSVDLGAVSNLTKESYKYNCAFMGDSITQFWASAGSGGHPEFFSQNNFLGKGISGQKTWEMLNRFKKDVIDQNPRSVIILAGTNNIGWYPDTCDVNVIKKHVAMMCEMASEANIRPIVCSILPRRTYNDKVIAANALLREYALSKGYAYVDYYSKMSVNNKITESYFRDGLHPNSDGFYVMEGICLPVIEEVILQ